MGIKAIRLKVKKCETGEVLFVTDVGLISLRTKNMLVGGEEERIRPDSLVRQHKDNLIIQDLALLF